MFVYVLITVLSVNSLSVDTVSTQVFETAEKCLEAQTKIISDVKIQQTICLKKEIKK